MIGCAISQRCRSRVASLFCRFDGGRMSSPRFAFLGGRRGMTRNPAMKRRRMIYEGKAKILYEGPEPGTVIQYFKDDTTAFDATKKAVLDGKGVLNNRISEHIY